MVGPGSRSLHLAWEVTEELNKEADKQEKLWREAIMSGAPTPHEWYQMAEFEMKSFKKELTDKGKNGQDKLVSLFRLEEEGVISHHEAEKAMAALRRLLLASKAAVDSLDDFIAGASLPLPSSPTEIPMKSWWPGNWIPGIPSSTIWIMIPSATAVWKRRWNIA